MKQIVTGKVNQAILMMVALLLLVSTVLAGGGGPPISRYVIGGGGGHSDIGRYIMDVTIGQAVAGTFHYVSYELCAGFWCGMGEYKVYLPVVLRIGS